MNEPGDRKFAQLEMAYWRRLGSDPFSHSKRQKRGDRNGVRTGDRNGVSDRHGDRTNSKMAPARGCTTRDDAYEAL